MRIRQATPEDHDVAQRLWKAAGFPDISESEWYAIVSNPATSALVAEQDGAVVGAAVASFDGWRAFLYHVAVDSAHRGKGIAKALMAEAEGLVRTRGARYMFAMVQDDNPAGLALATIMGFEPEGDLILVKDLVDQPALV
jgi:ribosomal protein S18 acetylase RimI-like enzyme